MLTSRTIHALLFAVLAAALGVCGLIARFSSRKRNLSTAMLLGSLVPPVLGNLIIVLSGDETISLIGCLMYYLGMDLVMYSLLWFTLDYCKLEWPSSRVRILVHVLLAVDVIQLLINPLTHHAFDITPEWIDGFNYYRMIPHLGQTFHRMVDYGIFGAVLVVFAYQTHHAPKLSKERYAIILLSMVVGGLWQTYYIFSGTPIDRSMVGFAVFGLLVFYFSIYYRPVRLLERMLSGIASNISDSLFFYDSEGACIWANDNAMRLTGAAEKDYTGAADRLGRLFPCVHNPEPEWTENRTLGSNEETQIFSIRKHALTEGSSGIAGSFITVQDHTGEQRELAQKLYAARHDQLTRLYARDYLYETVRDMLDINPETDYVICYTDFNDFKLVNDLYGNDFGDKVLQQFADFLRTDISSNGVFGRLGGDTFGACVPASYFDAERLDGLLSHFRVSSDNVEMGVHVHVGVYPATDRGLDVSVMFDRAHMALLSIKQDYHKTIAWYRDEMRAKFLWNQRISSELPEAIAAGQIRPFLQPIVDRSGKIIGAEALARWIHPKEGMLPPASFIPLLEQNGMVAEVDKHIWRCACETLARWKREGRTEFISVNISSKDFAFLNVAEELKSLVQEFGLDPSVLRLEITESVALSDVENPIAILTDLRQAGFIIEMDDFGSGYSSLNMLKEMPVDILKIDMVFLRRSNDREKSRIIVRHIIQMARSLGMVPLTEGVETEYQYKALLDMGCELFQGYYFSKPIPLEEFEKKINERALQT